MKSFLCAIAATLLIVSPSAASNDEAPKTKRGVVGVGGADWLIHPPPFPAFPVPNSFDASAGPWASSASLAALPLAAAAAAAAAAGPWAPRPITALSPAHATTALDLVALRKRIELAVAQQKYAAAAAAAASAREIAAVSAAKEAVREAAEQRNHAAKAAAAAAATFSQQSAHSPVPLSSRNAGPHSKPSYGPWQ
ncbi:uncharacterized protein [Hetaerina americana]|uniref:uncharacterized protein n=1 Tax=Hetaerina americana TaxID=62018 RepID=UPI003A7F1656